MSAAYSLPTSNVSMPLSLVPALPENKYCPLCKSRLPLDAFLPDGRSKKDGRRWYCMLHKIERAAYGSRTAFANRAIYDNAQEEIALENLLQLLTEKWKQINEMADAERQLLARKLSPKDWFLKFKVALAKGMEKLKLEKQAIQMTLHEALVDARCDLRRFWDEMRSLKQRVALKYGPQPLTFWERYCRAMGGLTS